MNPDNFEKQLKDQVLRPLPPGWRAEIHAAARQASKAVRAPRSSWLSILNSQLSTIFWPSPRVWAALAGIWVFILAVNLSVSGSSQVIAKHITPPSPQLMLALQQALLLPEFTEPRKPREAQTPMPIVPQPRSSRRMDFSTV